MESNIHTPPHNTVEDNNNNNNNSDDHDHHHIDHTVGDIELESIPSPTLGISSNNGAINLNQSHLVANTSMPNLTAIDINNNLSAHIQQYKDPKKTGVYVTAKNVSYYIPVKAKKNAPATKNYLLNNFNFYLKPGRMTLLIGTPGSGKSVLLKLLANRMRGGKAEGELLFNGHPVDEETHQADTIYVPQEDKHIALLTVQETLEFSAQSNMGPNVDDAVKRERVDLILEQMGLGHTRNTIVGNQFFRGVSGGQKKRVTIGVEFTKCPNLILLDEITTGLDSTTSLSIVSKVKTIAQDAGASTLITLLQPSPELTAQFDDVLLIGEKGKLCYFGPLDSIVDYFKTIGMAPLNEQPLAEFIQDVVEEPKKYLINQDNLENEIDLESLFKQSKYYEKSIEDVNNVLPKDKDSLFDNSKKENVRSPLWYEVKLCFERHIKIMKILKAEYITRFIQAIFMGFVVGSLFFQMGDTQANARDRFGLLYFSMILHIWTSYGAMDEFYQLRSVFYDQSENKQYRSLPFFISLVVSKIPISLIETLLYSTVCYWIAGYRARADSFIVFWLAMSSTNTISQGVFQMVASLSESQLISTLVCPAIVVLFMVFSGFILPQIPNYWIWMYHLSPFHYILDAIGSNEMHGATFRCTEAEMIPPAQLANLPYPIGFNGSQICPMTSGDDFLATFNMSQNYYRRWVDIAIALGFAVAFFFVFYMGMTYLRFETKRPPKTIKSRKNKLKKEKARESTEYKMKGCYMTFENLYYSVNATVVNTETGKKEKKKLTLLDNINGFVKPGLLALMGPSGAGKSTLIDVLSKRKNVGTISGSIQINGESIEKMNLNRFTGYVEQADILTANSTIREAIEFSANLRLPSTYPNADRIKLVEDIIKVLSLTKIQHTKIGPNPTMGISLANRKKVSIGIELASDPHLLFLDEPTSGLDSSAALKVMNCVKKIADSGKTVICTIHQPSQELFEMFDQLLLLSKGKTIYFGDTGKSSQNVISYFASKGFVMDDPNRNPSDFILDIAENHITGATDPVQAYEQSELATNTIQQLTSKSIVPEGIEPPSYKSQYGASMTFQLRCLLKRAWFNHLRRPTPILIRFLRAIIPSIIVGTLFLRLGNDQLGARNKLAMVYLSFLFGGMSAIGKIIHVIEDRAIFYRESLSGTYPSFLYNIATFVTDIPLAAMTATFYWIPFFWLTGLDAGEHGWKFFFTWGVYLLVVLCYDTMSSTFALVLPSIPIATLFCGMGLNFLALFGGFFIPKVSIPKAWLFMHYLAFTKYGFETLGITEIIDEKFECPDGKGAYNIPIATGDPSNPYIYKEFCPIQSGMVMIERYGLDLNRQYYNVIILGGYVLGFFTLGCFALRFIKHMRR